MQLCASMKGLVPNSELQFLIDGREVKSKGLTHKVVQICHSHLVRTLIVWQDGWKRGWLHIVSVTVYLVYQWLLSDPVSEIPRECSNLRALYGKMCAAFKYLLHDTSAEKEDSVLLFFARYYYFYLFQFFWFWFAFFLLKVASVVSVIS